MLSKKFYNTISNYTKQPKKEYQVYPSETVLFWYNGTVQSLGEIKTDDLFFV